VFDCLLVPAFTCIIFVTYVYERESTKKFEYSHLKMYCVSIFHRAYEKLSNHFLVISSLSFKLLWFVGSLLKPCLVRCATRYPFLQKSVWIISFLQASLDLETYLKPNCLELSTGR
jgi:hypothetical protein